VLLQQYLISHSEHVLLLTSRPLQFSSIITGLCGRNWLFFQSPRRRKLRDSTENKLMSAANFLQIELPSRDLDFSGRVRRWCFTALEADAAAAMAASNR
jgi:hypothetical protein